MEGNLFQLFLEAGQKMEDRHRNVAAASVEGFTDWDAKARTMLRLTRQGEVGVARGAVQSQGLVMVDGRAFHVLAFTINWCQTQDCRSHPHSVSTRSHASQWTATGTWTRSGFAHLGNLAAQVVCATNTSRHACSQMSEERSVWSGGGIGRRHNAREFGYRLHEGAGNFFQEGEWRSTTHCPARRALQDRLYGRVAHASA